MQPLEKKKSRNLWGQRKITQPLWTKKNHTTSLDKKNHATIKEKEKSRNFLGQKKSCNPLGGKNHATSRDKKNMQPLGTKKYCNLSLIFVRTF